MGRDTHIAIHVDTIPTKTGCTFLGWSTDSNATVAQYQPGSEFVTDATTTLYAVWKTDTILYGDANNDGKVDLRDATLIMQYYTKLIDHLGPLRQYF